MHGVSSTGSHGHPGYPAEYVRTIRYVTHSGAWAVQWAKASQCCSQSSSLVPRVFSRNASKGFTPPPPHTTRAVTGFYHSVVASFRTERVQCP